MNEKEFMALASKLAVLAIPISLLRACGWDFGEFWQAIKFFGLMGISFCVISFFGISGDTED